MNVRLRPATESDYDLLWWLHGATMRTYVAATEETETFIMMNWLPQTIAANDKGEPR